MSPAPRAITTALALLAIAAPAATAVPSRDLRSTSARADTSAAPQQDRRDNVLTGGVRAPDWLAPEAGDAATAVTTSAAARTPDAPTVDKTADQRFDWTSAGIGAGASIALLVIALAGAAAVTGRSRPAPH